MLSVCPHVLPTQDIAHKYTSQMPENSTALSDIVGVDILALGYPLHVNFLNKIQ